MFFKEKSVVNLLDQTKDSLAEMQGIIVTMEKQMAEFSQQLNMTSEELREYLENADNFSRDVWDKIQQEKDRVKEEFARDMDNIRNPHDAVERLKHLREVASFMESRRPY
jgi:hypothetical protein